jgi:hypothetical protein
MKVKTPHFFGHFINNYDGKDLTLFCDAAIAKFTVM